MKELFPMKQVNGFIFSLLLTVIALSVYFLDMSFAMGLTILIVTAFIQAGVQLIVFMHAGESEDKGTIYTSIYYGALIALLTVFGSLLAMVWGYM
ncbi:MULTISPECIES: cytochrome aa3 quinol oxidase subunit IV [Oceanobacillus]|uniref:Quinol oxidase subunit 4 n=1 Tax=Oceanobacillus kimchii TaxID=746691 RepID=A0ABQ5TKB8_9BACI|nr:MULTISPECIES: cytochrome aa3 quinol oxidase subunit IV [Oceanobacillus]MBT2600746.1 cytochrome aa3 quinol oxidase subunit IV [Oceanobacillus sp. ISL-74]MBT2650857.1 cytochrome aa3 quinol oxidase subunit IV [Oceanobacillus sp. ISL-73]MCT1575501.1 cytochrome aa3 quinol oxidase subunit IV [Oceanobacillus kimchii]MCT2138074.1 cytochrome aa3 quinol oxidase subunit IV [Oceanobacillus kimchii]OEH55318.1 cytochrome aa3 quinol oxidase subunit IV [Oceanobacillus sp. E9]